MEINELYLHQLKGFQKIIHIELVPKMGIMEVMYKRLSENNQDLAKKEPIFVPIYNSVRLDVFITIAKLLDGKRSGRNILKFIDFSEANQTRIRWKTGCIPNDIIARHRAIIAKNIVPINNLCARRDKYFAHNDKEYFLNEEKLDIDYPINSNEIINIINCFIKIINDHEFGINSSGTISTGDIYAATTEYLFDYYLKGKEMEKRGNNC